MSEVVEVVSATNKYFEISCSQSLVSTQIWPFVDRTNSNIFMMGYLYSMAKANLGGHKDELSQQVIFLSEIMADDLGKVKTMSRAKAFDNLIAAVSYLMKEQNLNKYVDIDKETWCEALTIENSALCKHYSPKINTKGLECFPWGNDVENRLYSGDAMIILFWLALRAKLYSITAVIKACITAYISFCSGGNPSNNALRKLAGLVFEDLHLQIEIDRYEVHMIYMVYGNFINENNAEVIFNKLLQMLPTCAVNVRSYLSYVSSRESIYLQTIKQALQLAPDFPWSVVERIIPGELQAAYEAVLEVRKKPYIIYNSVYRNEMKVYQNLAYICKEIMVQIFMKRGLIFYDGWTKTPMNKSFLDMLVCKYKYDLMHIMKSYPIDHL